MNNTINPHAINFLRLQDQAYRDGFNDLSEAIRGAMDELEKQGYTQVEPQAICRIVDACLEKLSKQDFEQIIDLLTVDGTPQ